MYKGAEKELSADKMTWVVKDTSQERDWLCNQQQEK